MQIYSGLFAKDFRFKDQIRSAAISVVSNIAIGDELKTNSQRVNFLYYAKGSCAELITQLTVAFEIAYIDIENFNDLADEYEHVSHMLAKLIRARKNNTKKP